MALWRAYQRALAAHPWKVQVLTAAAGGEAGSAGTPERPDSDHDVPGLWLCGPCGRRLVQGFGSVHPWHHQGGCTEKDDVGSGGLCPVFSRLLSPTGRGTQWTVSQGQLGQTTAAMACCAVSQLLPGPPSLQVGRCPMCCCYLELLPVLEGTSALSWPHSIVSTLQ
ncbi:PREDICTED: protein Mpv17 isoform X4 [Rhinopithecus bieti]|uniref:protein Mpv17 isoform X4 n=1 Tax=Rhinopithecus bieti TaxID=61621 RepID=UPI00083BB409|nr:PREDICTED: protein Mpv17 isoform X4 [Rhinopithecus bieti]